MRCLRRLGRSPCCRCSARPNSTPGGGAAATPLLRAKYLRIVMLYLLAGEGPAPRFPMIRRAGARLLLVETVAGLAGVTYGLDAAPLRRIVAEYGLDAWLLRRTRLAPGATAGRAACCCSLACPSAQPRRTAPRVMPRAATAMCVSSR